ncbi:MAG: EamA family transporter [Bacteroidota bacterium]
MNQQKWLIIGAFFCTYVIWGSTYLANYWAIQSIPIFGMGAARFLVAGLLLYGMSLFVGDKTRPTLRQWGNATIQGALFLAVGVGAVVWAQQYIPTSTTALIISFEPLLVMLLMWGWFKNRPPVKAFIGAAISIVGMSLLIQEPASFDGPEATKGLIGILFGMSCWAVGIVLGGKLDMGANKFRATGMQMLTGGFLLLVFSFVVNDWAGWSPSQVTQQSFLAWLFLVFFGAILSFSAFNYLLRTVSADMAATNTYVNPVVAVLLGGLLNNEVISGQMIIAGALLLTGVYFINSAKRKKTMEEKA